MPWKASSVMQERPRFVARLLDGEPMAALCWEFGISRNTGYKILSGARARQLFQVLQLCFHMRGIRFRVVQQWMEE
jgi:hypothetical protein